MMLGLPSMTIGGFVGGFDGCLLLELQYAQGHLSDG